MINRSIGDIARSSVHQSPNGDLPPFGLYTQSVVLILWTAKNCPKTLLAEGRHTTYPTHSFYPPLCLHHPGKECVHFFFASFSFTFVTVPKSMRHTDTIITAAPMPPRVSFGPVFSNSGIPINNAPTRNAAPADIRIFADLSMIPDGTISI